jgi:1-phosphofructokinase
MILTIALNPSIEKNISLDELRIGEENSMSYHNLMLGESAIYSAYIIKLLQGEPYVLGFAGGIGGRYIKYFTDSHRIKSDLLWKEQETRSITRIVSKNEVTTLINNGFDYDEKDVKNFKLKFNSHIKDMYGVVINNFDTNNQFTKDMLEICFKLADQYQLKSILSLSGDELRHALHYNPYALVLNPKDLNDLNIFYKDEKEQLEALHTMLINDKIHMLYYQDDRKLYAITKNKMAKVIFEKPIESDRRMKDMLTGVLGVCVSRKYEIEKSLRLMGAVLMAADFEGFPNICTRKEVSSRQKKITLIEVYNQRNGYLIK